MRVLDKPTAESPTKTRIDYSAKQILFHFLALTALIVAQPTFSVYRSNPDIFVARSTPPIAVAGLALVVAILPSLALWLTAVLVGLGGRRWRTYMAMLWVGALTGLFALQIAARLNLPWPEVSLAVSLAVGIACAAIYGRISIVGRYLSFLAVGPVVVMAVFLLTPPIGTLTFPRVVGANNVVLSDLSPVVFMLFDEFPQVSLLDEDQLIDRERYPNIAELADRATWYRNAAPAHTSTVHSVASLLSGQMPEKEVLASASDLPNNIFTLFGRTHTLEAIEPVTNLCPESLCPSGPVSVRDELEEMSVITAQLFGRIVAPDHFDDDILTLSDPFDITTARDQRERFRAFIDSIGDETGRFYFGHFFLPHIPFHYLPSGLSYNRLTHRAPGLDEHDVWSGDPWNTFDNHQRHMLQVGALDTLIGELIDHLKQIGIYDEAMIVLTSDHGVSHIHGETRRLISEENLFDIGLVPLIIKAPNQVEGEIDDSHVQGVDVIPTLAELMGANRSWPGDGLSVVGGSPREQLTMTDQHYNELEIDVAGSGRAVAIQRIIDRFGESSEDHDLFSYGDYADLVGATIDSLSPGPPVLSATIEEPPGIGVVDPASGFVPAYVQGRVENLGELSEEPRLALALNGVIGAVVDLHDIQGDSAAFGGVVDDSLFVSGHNELSILSLHEAQGRMAVNDVAVDLPPAFSLSGQAGAEVVESSDGISYPVDTSRIDGAVHPYGNPDGRVDLIGWAIDQTNLTPAEMVLVFSDGQFVVGVVPNLERAGLVEDFGAESVLMSGFAVSIPRSAFSGDPDQIEAFAISVDRSTRLPLIEPAETPESDS
jgi:hypothetical protein